MLVLSRKGGEKIHIGEGIVLTVVEVRGNVVRLGIDAPEDVPIVRDELLGQRAVKNEKQEKTEQP